MFCVFLRVWIQSSRRALMKVSRGTRSRKLQAAGTQWVWANFWALKKICKCLVCSVEINEFCWNMQWVMGNLAIFSSLVQSRSGWCCIWWAEWRCRLHYFSSPFPKLAFRAIKGNELQHVLHASRGWTCIHGEKTVSVGFLLRGQLITKIGPGCSPNLFDTFPSGTAADWCCVLGLQCTRGRKRRHFTEIRDDGHYVALIFHLDKVQTWLALTLPSLSVGFDALT